MSIIGDKIKQRRIHMDWTQETLAQKIDTTKHVISNWERGVANPDYKQIILLATVFHVTTDFLLGLSEFPDPQYRDPFGQLHLFPMIDYSFINVASWDLIKLLNSGIDLSVNEEILSFEDRQHISELVQLTINRLQQVRRETRI
ncbi:DNA-binding transcriptional regulator, XRE-family HTH domain [Paenibacillus sophorae]|uniref:DNA-binding transcriptional regulator, XRE-family HTH domain n=1 Tax=Paenibacillus sophorae TaxID=1333845 RepID=A0A1H8VY05_9BACL|nr:helix-turn-helix transcriptional regulator [Paenibacillus sophorae]QWU15620.1 helix-turn-helix domain-containing protein [Paenibacillus sophorae]SEP19798.1 DNA-binding transcriptional regulator, XRE-family HTH domain [Paenibacillus sophorae]